MTKQARADHPVHELIAARWSPYSFADREVSDADLRSLLEAARWAPSSYNEQPWRYMVAQRSDGDAFEGMLSCLVEPNRAWAQHASALLIGVASLHFSRNDKPNAAALHDLGLAAAHLTFEATARGIDVHQMIGILPDRARELYGIPAGYEAVTALAIGYAGERAGIDSALRDRDQSERNRRPLAEFVFAGRWQQTAALVQGG